METHKHKWIFAGIHCYSNQPSEGWTDWVCECGVVKNVTIKHDANEVIDDD